MAAAPRPAPLRCKFEDHEATAKLHSNLRVSYQEAGRWKSLYQSRLITAKASRVSAKTITSMLLVEHANHIQVLAQEEEQITSAGWRLAWQRRLGGTLVCILQHENKQCSTSSSRFSRCGGACL